MTATWGLGDVVAGYVLAVVAATVAVSATQVMMHDDPGAVGATLAGFVGLWVGFLGAPVFASRRKGAGSLREDFGFAMDRRDIVRGLAVGIASQVVLLPLLYLFLRPWFDIGDANQPVLDLARVASPVALVALGVAVVVAAPIIEELFFRGLLVRALQRRFGVYSAVGISAMIFGATHFEVVLFPGLALFGVVLAVLTVRSGRLGPAIWAHIGFNATTLAILIAGR